MAHAGWINIAISEFAIRYRLGAQFEMALYAKIFEPFPLFDGALAFILCMAADRIVGHPNIPYIQG
jgi:hypothetical protein